jgi:E3 ubiquitin-protein ligase RNF115/126
MDEEFASLFASRPPPPASKKFVEEHVKDEIVREDDVEADCPVCLKPFEEGETVNALPCKHKFHKECIMPWLEKVHSVG